MDCALEKMLRQSEVHISCWALYLLRERDFGDISSVGQPFFLPSSFSFLVIASARGGVIQFNSIFNQTILLEMVKPSLEGNCFMYF